MKNNKGFTLIEIIAVVTILAVISLLSFATLTRTLKDNKNKELEVFDENVINAAEIYVQSNIKSFPQLQTPAGGEISFSIKVLVDAGYLSNDLINPTTCSLYKTEIVATKDIEGVISYKVNHCSINPADFLKPGITYVAANETDTHKGILYLDPTDLNIKCTADKAKDNSKTGVKTGCMKWYVIDDDGKELKLILDHNTSDKIQWDSTLVYQDFTTYNHGPKSLLDQLKKDTQNWTEIPVRNDKYVFTDPYGKITIDYSGYRAKLPSLSEMGKIVKGSGWKDDRYYVDNFEKYGDYKWIYELGGFLLANPGNYKYVDYYLAMTIGNNDIRGVHNPTGGLRPVISIPRYWAIVE